MKSFWTNGSILRLSSGITFVNEGNGMIMQYKVLLLIYFIYLEDLEYIEENHLR